MIKVQEIKEKYVADADMMASKSRFGYFTLPPSHTAAHTDFAQTARNKFSIQHTEMPTVRSSHSLQISIAELQMLPVCKKTTSRTLPQLFMALNTKIQESISANSRLNNLKNNKEKTYSDLLNSTSLCIFLLK